jgi:hypothetical protein
MDDLRRRTIRLAFEKPHLRAHLLPVLARGQAELPPRTEVGFSIQFHDAQFQDDLDRGKPEAIFAEQEILDMGEERWLGQRYRDAANDLGRMLGAKVKCETFSQSGKSGEAQCEIKNVSRKVLEKILGLLERGKHGWADLPATYMSFGFLQFAPGGDWWTSSYNERDIRVVREYLEDLDDPPYRGAAGTTGLPEELIQTIHRFNREHRPFIAVALRNVPPKALRSQRAWEDYWGNIGGSLFVEEEVTGPDDYEQEYDMIEQPGVVKRVTRELGLGSLRPDADDLLGLAFTLKGLGREVFEEL